MENKIEDYVILSTSNDYQFQKDVRAYLEKGYHFLGNLQITTRSIQDSSGSYVTFTREMVKYEF
jgi:predicted porin